MGTGATCHDVDMATRDLDRLARRVKAQRMELFTSRKAAADAAGISKDTWRRVEEGLEVWDSKLARIDKALGWAVSSCVAIAEGGEPILVGGAPGSVAAGELRPTEEEVRKAAFEAAMVTMPAAAIGDVQAFVDRLVKDLRRVGEIRDDD